MTIEKPKNFAKSLNNKKIIFVLICVDIDKITITNDFIVSIISKQLNEYLKQFDNKIAKILIKQKNTYYTINLIKNQKFSFIILYNLFQKKLVKLR